MKFKNFEKGVLEVEIGDLPDYEELVAFIHENERSIADAMKKVRGNFPSEPSVECISAIEVAMLHKEKGPDKVKVRFSKEAAGREYDYKELIKTLSYAKEELLK